MAGTIVSDTDLMLFAEMANPTKTNLHMVHSGEAPSRDASSRIEEVVASSSSSGEEEDSEPESPPPQTDVSAASSRASTRADRSRVASTAPPAKSDVASVASASEVTAAAAPGPPSAFATFLKQTRQAVDHDRDSRESSDHHMLEKQQALLDLEKLKLAGTRLSKQWTLDDRLEDMRFEVRRHTMHQEEQNNVATMRDAMRMACTGIEMIATRTGALDLKGWSSIVCRDMSRYDAPMGKLYRKYWRRGNMSSPESEILLGIAGSLIMHHVQQKMNGRLFSGSMPTARGMVDSDDEEPPP